MLNIKKKFLVPVLFVAGLMFQSNCHSKIFVYMTFDDGVWGDGSMHVASILGEKKVPGTVFLVGSTMRERTLYNDVDKEHWRKCLEAYDMYSTSPFIEMANHSLWHAHGMYRDFYKDPMGVYQEFVKNQSFLKISQKIVRLPGRNAWHTKKRIKDDGITKDTLESIRLLFQVGGFYVVGWDTEWFAPRGILESYEKVYERIKAMGNEEGNSVRTFTKGHVVLLCHDGHYSSAANKRKLGALVDLLKNDPEVEIAFISKYPGIDL